MKLDSQKIIDILISGHYVSEEDIEKAKEFVKTHNILITDYLLREELINKDLLGQAIAEAYELVYADLNSHQPSKEQVLRIPEKIARQYRLVLFSENETTAIVATDSPAQDNLKTIIAEIFPKKEIKITYSLTEDIDDSFANYRKSLDTRFARIIEQKKKVAPEIIDEIISDSITHKASDIHFEPDGQDVNVRFRIDGVLHEAGIIPKIYYENILNRVKVQAKLRIDEHSSTQDGSIRYQLPDSRYIDLRISLVPTLDGEKIAIRVLAEYIRNLNLDDLGLSPENQKILVESSNKPFGMILVVGPTGSGKTTTLYALLKMLNHPEVNITTIEDPVEYKISGINQIQINNQANLSFAKGLRSIIRQDPDVILVGEIRDEETTEIAINAALTGHLLLSTFHSNDAATAIPRLLDMEAEPFLLASTLELVIAQRLLRKICENCRVSISEDDPSVKKYLPALKTDFIKDMSFYKGKGCHICGHSGYSGRTAIYEFIKISPEIKDLIMKRPAKKEIWELAMKQGSKPMFEDGLSKVKSGLTSLEELFRVAPPDELSK